MIRTLSLRELLTLYQQIMQQSGGLAGIRQMELVESALLQAGQTFDGQELYPQLHEKAAVLGFLLIRNHPFVDGNKRIGHAAMELTLLVNGYEIVASVDEQEALILALAAGSYDLTFLTQWLEIHMLPRRG